MHRYSVGCAYLWRFLKSAEIISEIARNKRGRSPECQYTVFMYIFSHLHHRQRPYHVEYTASRPISEVKQRWAWLVLGWVTAWEYAML